MLISLLVLLPLIFIALSIILWTLRLGIGPTPSSPKVIKTIQDILPDSVNGEVIEMGCGWGQLLPTLIKRYSSCPVIAYERSPVPFYFSYHRFKSLITVKKDDFFQADLSQAGLVICYLYPGAMKRFSKEIMPKLPENCWVISHTFSIPGYTPNTFIRADDLYHTPVYLYKT